VKEDIAAKAKGVELAAPAEVEEPDVINLMDALKKSVAQTAAKSPRKRTRRKTARRRA
jgi:non-homologous end joining protein Ku